MKTTFNKVNVGTKFTCNGNEYVKTSSRTAQMVLLGVQKSQWFYFRQVDQVEVSS